MQYRHKLVQTVIRALFALYRCRIIPTLNLSPEQLAAVKRQMNGQ